MAQNKIFVTHQSPLIDEHGVQQYISEITIEELKRYGDRFLTLIRFGIEAFNTLMTESIDPFKPCTNMQGVEWMACVLNKLADSIVIALRSYFVVPLTPPPKIRTIGKTFTPSDILYAWSLGRELESIGMCLDKLKKVEYECIEKTIENMLKGFFKASDRTFLPSSEDEALERLYLLMKLPADTRPGCSVSKLIPHLLASSALAIAKYVNRLGKRRVLEPRDLLELGLLRLAALLHDIGKPESWARIYGANEFEDHAKASARLLNEKLGLKTLLSDTRLGEIFDILIKLIENHHSPRNLPEEYCLKGVGICIELQRLGELLHEADRDSSQMDRLGEIFAKATRDLLEEYAKGYGVSVEDLYIGTGSNIWRAWMSMPEDVVRKVAERISGIFKARIIPADLLESDRGVGETDVKLLIVDIGAIQRFIRRESLKVVIGASFVVDLYTQYVIPRAIIEILGLALESIVYAGGGMVLAFVPAKTDEEIISHILQRTKDILPFEIELYASATELYANWPYTIRLASARTNAKKVLKTKTDTTYLPLGIEVMCEYCGVKPATTVDNYNRYLCDECKHLLSIGEDMYIESKIYHMESLGYNVTHLREKEKEELKKVKQYFMQWLSGVKLENLGREQYRIAITKIDGNAAGQYMASAINITEAICRSIRLDMGLKMGFITALNKLRQYVGDIWDEIVARMYIGTLYAGGDDMLAIWPANISIPFALTLAKTFWRINGGVVSLSIAIVASKPKHNIWNVIDASSELLNMCKKQYRRMNIYALEPNVIALISMFKSDTQVFGVDVEQSFRDNNMYTYQPLVFAITPQQTLGCSDIMYLLQQVLSMNIDAPDKALDILFRSSLQKSIGIDKDKEIPTHRISSYVVEISTSPVRNAGKEVLALFLARASARTSDAEGVVLRGLARLSVACRNLPPLFDLYHMFEILSEGITI